MRKEAPCEEKKKGHSKSATSRPQKNSCRESPQTRESGRFHLGKGKKEARENARAAGVKGRAVSKKDLGRCFARQTTIASEETSLHKD